VHQQQHQALHSPTCCLLRPATSPTLPPLQHVTANLLLHQPMHASHLLLLLLLLLAQTSHIAHRGPGSTSSSTGALLSTMRLICPQAAGAGAGRSLHEKRRQSSKGSR
jgi:hypothetical protein